MSDLLDADGFSVGIDEGESLVLSSIFRTPDNEQFTKAALLTLTATLLNKADNTVINSRDDLTILDANGGEVSDEGVLTLTLDPEDNPIVDSDLSEEIHVLILKWSWSGGTGIERYEITVNNIEAVDETVITPTVAGLDLSGIRRVKTKHMEVESWDPRIVQEARDKENTPLPSFCCLTFCKGTPK